MRIRDADTPFKLPGSDSPLKSTLHLTQEAHLSPPSSTATMLSPTISTMSTVGNDLFSPLTLQERLRQHRQIRPREVEA
jgi:hypothetical protein